jgi:hypothetical protein
LKQGTEIFKNSEYAFERSGIYVGIIEEVESYLSNFYVKLLNIPATPAERFQEGFGKFYGVSSKTVPEQTILFGSTLW